AVSSVNTTVNTAFNSATFLPFNPFTDTPVECPQYKTDGVTPTPAADCKAMKANFQKGSSFGKAASTTSFQAPRQYYFNFGVRF
ncbi:MAG TPA: hypothetical protein VHU41_05450, partial [Thermoanaerobaculia bacterium]|nr:hypothetical protein [Thermoanaerobaculia bacterium]